MKTNEAPKKIYFCTDENYIHYYSEETPNEREYIEYISTDAFIEKACEWIKENIDFEHDYPATKEELIKDFSRAMKGE